MSQEDKDLDQKIEIEEVLAEAKADEVATDDGMPENSEARVEGAITSADVPAAFDGTPKAPTKNPLDADRNKRKGAPQSREGGNRDSGSRDGGNRRPGGPGGPGGGAKRGRGRQEQAEQPSEFTEKVVQVRRVTKVVKGGKKLSFRTTVIIGNEKGKVGVGVGKAAEVLIAIKKAISDAKKNLVDIETVAKTNTISHSVVGEAGGGIVLLKPAADGTGIIAGGTARIVLELAGVGDILAKSKGSKSPLNVARATVNALQQLRSFQEVAGARGITVKNMLF
jgi:small subunit ribosomal protein S5